LVFKTGKYVERIWFVTIVKSETMNFRIATESDLKDIKKEIERSGIVLVNYKMEKQL
jgi:hypothetical protein